ncbi:MAG: hypothetical protein HY647_09170, partial [Acidobacteria bacterium]|nr:hypothetical protein [Acidobacteriota bacterium]
MEYPQSFPTHLQPPIEAAIAEADIEFVKAKKRLRSRCYGNEYAVGRLILKFVKKVFFALAGQARQAVAEGLWTGERIRSALDDFLHKLIVEAYHQKNTQDGPLLEILESDATRRMEQEVKESNEWVEHQEQLVAIAKARATPNSIHRSIPKNLRDGRHKGPAPTQAESVPNGGNGNGADPVAVERETLLKVYKDEGMRRGKRITDKMIAKAARPTWNDRTPVQRWKRNDPRCTH